MRATSLCVCCLSGLFLAGCSGNAVVEDRTIAFGADGATSFQHGSTGVFLDVDGETRSIFTPDEDVLATSSPLWSPDKQFALFTTATAIDGTTQTRGTVDWNATPDGRQFLEQAVNYTCWLYDATSEAGEEPRKLFEVGCGHVGYVAANLAVRWTPDGKGIAFVSANKDGDHELHRWSIADGSKSRLFPHFVDWLTFSYAPDGQNLIVCIEDTTYEGVWAGSGGTNWKHLASGRGPHRLRNATASLASLFSFVNLRDAPLERLRGLLPVWSADRTQFAFITWEEAGTEQGDRYSLFVGSATDMEPRLVRESEIPFSDARWHPDGSQLGVIRHAHTTEGRGIVATSLHAIPIDGGNESPLTDRTVRQFAGWNADGINLAVVAPEKKLSDEGNWAFALFRNQPGRESLVVSGSDGEREVFSGTRVTFPNWSPDGHEISFWATFVPVRRSFATFLAGDGLANGDPAATINIQTKEIRWMPVSAIEKLQIGHYYLLKNNLSEAMRWYDEAATDLPATNDANRALLTAAPLYRSICLTRLNRLDEAEAEFEKFKTLAMQRPKPEGTPAVTAEEILNAAVLSRYMLLLEIYLSVDAIDECRQLLETPIADPNAPAIEDFVRQIALSQVLLVQDDRSSYIRLASEKLMPNAIRLLGPSARTVGRMVFDNPVFFSAQLSLLPLLSEDFLAGVDATDLKAASGRLEELRAAEASDIPTLVLDTILTRTYRATSNVVAESEAADRIAGNPMRAGLDDQSIANAIEFLRWFPAMRLQDPADQPEPAGAE